MNTVCSSHRRKNYIIAWAASAGVAVCIGLLLFFTGAFWQGSDFFTQLYRLDEIAKAWQEGQLYPLLAENWYNGYEIFRFTSPVSYLLIHLLSLLCAGDLHGGICLFYGLMVFLSQMGFMLFGVRHQKMTAAFFTGLAFLFLPHTLQTALFLGSLDILMGILLLPLLLYYLFEFIRWKHRLALCPFSILLCLLILSNYMLAIAFGAVIFFYLIFAMLTQKVWRFETMLAADMLFLYLAMGYFLYPAISGGLLTHKSSVYSTNGTLEAIVLLAVSLLGLLTANRDRAAGFFLAAVLALLSLPALEPVRRLIPFPALRDSGFFIAGAGIFCLLTLLCWEKLKNIFLLILLCIPTCTGVYQLTSLESGNRVLECQEALIQDYLLDQAASLTDSRIALMDTSLLGAFPHWYFASRGVAETYGWDYENAEIKQHLSQLNEAFADGFYDYMFDRLFLYGNDVVVIPKELLTEEGALELLSQAASRLDYEIAAENEMAVVYKAVRVQERYGVISQYDNLAIGDNAFYISYIYPSFGLGQSSCLEDYTVDELMQYQNLYLSGFTYRDKGKAENMLQELSQKGVNIFIDMQHIPINALTGKNEFLGVYAQFIQFTDQFPILENENGNQFKLDFRDRNQSLWNTVYISGCSRVLKEARYSDKSHLTYLGQNEEENITFIGLNLVYYYLETHNSDLLRFLDETLNISHKDLPKREILSIIVEKDTNAFILQTEADKITSGLAAVDTLVPDRIISTEDDLWVINEGSTCFRMVYPNQAAGLVCSILGLIGIGFLWIAAYVVLEDYLT